MECNCNKPTIKKNENLCVICDSTLFGRSDKRFCSPKCKNKYHSELRKTNKSVSNETIKVLYKNYQILSSLIGKNTSKIEINKLVLQRKGFDFDTVSGMEVNKFGFKLKLFDFSWYLSSHSKIVVYHNPEQEMISPFVYKRWERFGIAN